MTFWRTRLARSTVLAGLFVTGSVALAQAPPPGRETSAASVASLSLSQQMPVDPEVAVGTLPNGLRYYVRAECEAGAPRRAAARRQGRVGAGRRRPAGAGALRRAHGVRRDASISRGRASSSSCRRSGLSIGADANAATSYDDTQYTLRVPTDVPGVLDRALLVLEDWAGARHVRSGRHRSRARHRALGMADAPRRRRAHRRTRSGACSSKDRATRIGRRSASPRSSRGRSASS